MRSNFLLAFCLLVQLGGISRAAAQCADLPPIALQGGDAACITQSALCERVAELWVHGAHSVAADLSLSLQLTAAESKGQLLLLRAGEPVAIRTFEGLPAACAELRDMLALSMALAIEHAQPERGRARADRGTTTAAVRGSHMQVPARALPEPAPSQSVEPVAALDVGPPVFAEALSSQNLEPTSSASAQTPESVTSHNATQDEYTSITSAQSFEHAASAWHLHAGAQAMLYALASPLWLGSAGVEWMPDRFSLRLAAIGGGVVGLAFGRGSADVSLAGAELAGCGAVAGASLLAQLCLGVLGAGVFARGQGFASDLSGTSAWGAGSLAGAIRWPSTARLALQLSVRGLYNVVRPALRVTGVSERLLWASLGASAGLELIFALP